MDSSMWGRDSQGVSELAGLQLWSGLSALSPLPFLTPGALPQAGMGSRFQRLRFVE